MKLTYSFELTARKPLELSPASQLANAAMPQKQAKKRLLDERLQ